jgi:hypothetical protein
MWEPRPLTPLWAFTACYRDSFTFIHWIGGWVEPRTGLDEVQSRKSCSYQPSAVQSLYWLPGFPQEFITSFKSRVRARFANRSSRISRVMKYIHRNRIPDHSRWTSGERRPWHISVWPSSCRTVWFRNNGPVRWHIRYDLHNVRWYRPPRNVQADSLCFLKHASLYCSI